MTDIQNLLETGLEHHRAGRLDDAADIYREALALDRDNAEAHHLLGIVALQSGKPSEAVDWLVGAVQRAPENAKYLGNLGAAHLADGRPSDAVDVLEKAAIRDPGSIDILCNLAVALRETRRGDEAVATYQKAHALAPGDASILSGLATTWMALGRLDVALEAADRAMALDGQNGEWRNIRGGILLSMARYDEALIELETAISLAPDLADARCNYALALQNVHRLDEAERVYRTVVDQTPENAPAHAGLGRTLRLRGDLTGAIASYRHAVALNSGNARTHSSLLFNLLGDPDTDEAALFQAHRDWHDRHAAPLMGGAVRHGNDTDPDRRLRIGYVSSDFRTHPVGRLVCPIFDAHDRSAFEIFAYSQAASADDMTRRIEAAADQFRPIAALEDAAVVSLIRDDGIDILVDLSGHSARNRLTVFARRPAPVQATWLGYMASTGLEAMDYLIGDPVHTPAGDEACYSETVLRLPRDLLCFSPPDGAPDMVPPPASTGDGVTFGCFNNPGKITQPVLDSWARVLLAVPHGRLYLRYLDYEDHGVQRDFRDRLGALGIDGTRIRFAGKASYQDVLASYGEVDIALDTFPYSGTMTTLEALWMGVPVVALMGERMVARQAAAHLTAAGLPELVAADAGDYVDLAISLANDRARLAELRSGMRDRLQASPLCDLTGFTHSLEALYRGMWHRWCAARQGGC